MSFEKSLFFVLLFALFTSNLYGQYTISYPTPSEDLNVCQEATSLEISLTVTDDNADGNFVYFNLPFGVTYEPGSINVLTSNNGLSLVESSITNLNEPVFELTPLDLNSGDLITFTIDRKADCDAISTAQSGTIFKDTMEITSNLGSFWDDEPLLNSYNVYFPSLSFTQPAAVNAVVNSTNDRDIIFTNGGFGCLTELNFYTINDGNVHNTLTAGGNVLTPTATNGDTTFYFLDQSVITLFGNGNDCFENGEEITLSENFTIRSCNATTFYGISWGCEGQICREFGINGQINVPNGVPNIQFLESRVSEGNSCTNAVLEVIYTNNGTETITGASSAYNLIMKFGTGFSTSLIYQANINYTNFTINGVSLTDTLTNGYGVNIDSPQFVNLGELTADPDGPGGLEDLDGDGEFDDLAVGESIVIRFEAIFPCLTGCPIYTYYERFQGQACYTDQCGIQEETDIKSGYGGVYNFGASDGTVVFAPTDVEDGDIFTAEFCQSMRHASNYYGQGLTCPTDSICLKMVLPPGLSYVGSPLMENLPADATVIGDTIWICGELNQTSPISVCLSMDLAFSCGSWDGNSLSVPSTIEYTCDNSCSCIEEWGCLDMNISPHCPGCTEGLTGLEADAERITMGFSDPSGSTFADASTLDPQNLNTAWPCDLVRLSSSAVQIGSNQYDNANLDLTYNTIGGLEAFDVLNGLIEVYDASTSTTYSCITPTPTKSITGGVVKYNFDFSSLIGNLPCGLPAGFQFQAGDSVKTYLDVVILENDGFSCTPTSPLSGLKFRYFNIEQATGDEIWCDSWGTELYLHKRCTEAWQGQDKINNGCTTYSNFISYRFRHGAYDLYPGEIRPYERVDSFVFCIFSGDEFDPSVTPTLSSRGTVAEGYPGNSIMTNLPPPIINGNNLTWVNDGTWPLGDMRIYEYSAYQLNFSLQTTCSSTSADNQFKVYSTDLGDFSNVACQSPQLINKTNTIVNNLAEVAVSDLTGCISATRPVESWDIEIRNIVAGIDAEYIWVALEDVPSGINVLNIYDQSNGGTPVTLIPYSNGKWIELTPSLGGGDVQVLRVEFEYDDCAKDSIKVITGFDCVDYPSNPTTAKCEGEGTYLEVKPSPSEVQISLASSPSGPQILCDTLVYEVELGSAQLSYLVDPYIDITLITGLYIAADPIVEYPIGSGNFQTIPATIVGNLATIDVSQHTSIGAFGIPGTQDALTSDERGMKIFVKFLTNCEFISGSRFQFIAHGLQPCTDPAIGDGIAISSDNLYFPDITSEYESIITASTTSIPNVCSESVTADIEILIVGGSTSTSDTSYIELPTGASYVPGSITCIASPGIFCPVSINVSTVGGNEVVAFEIPAGMNSSDILDFDFDIETNPAQFTSGDSLTITNTTIISNVACGNSFCDAILAETGEGSSLIEIIPLVPLNPQLSSTPAICFGESNGSASIIGSGGLAPYQYLWQNGETTTSNTGLSAGTYLVTVTDQNGCSATSSTLITEPTLLTLSVSADTPVVCNDQSNGVATATPNGGTPGYTFVWDNGETSPTASGLSAGTHIVTVTDNNDCQTTASVLVTEPDLLSATPVFISNITCNGLSDGSAGVTVTGGAPGYTYSWDNGENTPTANSLSAGTHLVTVVDNNGCVATASITLIEPDILAAGMNGEVCELLSSGETGALPASDVVFDISGNPNDYAIEHNLNSVTVKGVVFSIFIAPDLYSTTIPQPTGPNQIFVLQNATKTVDYFTSGANWPTDVLPSYQSPNLNYFVGMDVDVANTLYHEVHYSSPIKVTSGLYLFFMERNLNNPIGIEAFDASGNSLGPKQSYTSVDYLPTGVQISRSDGNSGEEAGVIVVPIEDFASLGYKIASIKLYLEHNNSSDEADGKIFIFGNNTPTCLPTEIYNVSCNGLSDGGATVAVSGGTRPYSYIWDNGETTNTVTNLIAGTHSATVTDANNCTIVASVTITQPPILLTTTTHGSNVSCNGLSDGSATTIPAGGTGPYTFMWDNSETTNTATSLAAGTHTVTISDQNNCTTTSSILISEPTVLIVSASEDNPVSCNGLSDGVAAATANGGTPGYTFAWDNGEATAIATSLAAGSHTVSVTDNNGCQSTANVLITEPDLLSAATTLVSNVSCNGLSDGAATVTATGGTTPYTYNWDNSEITATANSLEAGTHLVTVTDNNGCITTTSITILEPDVLAAGMNGEVCELISSGETGPLPASDVVFDISGNPSNYSIVHNLDSITVKGNVFSNFIAPDSYTTTIPMPNSQNRMYVIENGIKTFDYFSSGANWSNDASSSYQSPNLNFYVGIDMLVANTLYNEVHYNTPITVTSGFYVFFMERLSNNFIGIEAFDGNGNSLGPKQSYTPADYLPTGVQISSLGGAGGQEAGVVVIPIEDFANLGDEIASIRIYAEHNSSDEADGKIFIFGGNVPTCLPTEIYNVSCNGLSDGGATVAVSGGTKPYTYLWDNGVTDNTVSNLNAGIHSATVTDANNCTIVASVTITEPPILVTTTTLVSNVSCNGLSDGSATTTPSGGTSPYTYMWDNAETTSTATSLTAGTQTVTITDQNNCTTTSSIVITEPATLLALSSLSANVTCNGLSDGSATVIPSGGTLPYTFAWDNSETTNTATALTAGTHLVTITDQNNCTTTSSILITEPNLLLASATEGTPVSCNGLSDGAATVTASGGTTAYTFEWDNGETTGTATGLGVGIHLITVTDQNGCVATTQMTTTEPTILEVSTSPLTAVSCNGLSDGSASATPTGGVSPYTFAWDNGETTSAATGLNAGTHIVTITDQNNCTTTSSILITEPNLLLASATEGTPVSCNGLSDGVATVTATGGTTNYTFAWDNGETTATATGLGVGIHLITVTDQNGCVATTQMTTTEPTILEVSTSPLTAVSCNGLSDGSASATPTGGVSPYTFAWDNGETISAATGLNAGTHIVTITDQNNCTTTSSILITEPNLLLASATEGTAVSCNGLSDGVATVTASGGTTNYTFEWDNGETTATATGLGVGSI